MQFSLFLSNSPFLSLKAYFIEFDKDFPTKKGPELVLCRKSRSKCTFKRILSIPFSRSLNVTCTANKKIVKSVYYYYPWLVRVIFLFLMNYMFEEACRSLWISKQVSVFQRSRGFEPQNLRCDTADRMRVNGGGVVPLTPNHVCVWGGGVCNRVRLFPGV